VKSWWFRLAVTLAVLTYLVSNIDGARTLSAMASLAWPVIGALAALTALDRALAAWRWILLVRAAEVPLSYRSGVRVFLVTSFLGSFAPSGVGGDIARAWEITRRTSRDGEAVAAVAVDRWLGVASVALVGVLGLALWTGRIDLRLSGALYVLTAVMLAGAVAGVWADRLVVAALPDAWQARRPWRFVVRLARAMQHYRREWPTLLLVAALSLGVQLLRVLLMWVTGRGLGVDVAFEYYLVFVPLTIIVILLPISISGLGPGQGAIVWMLAPLGVPEHLAFAMGTIFILLGLLSNLPGGLLFLVQRPPAPHPAGDDAHRRS
jgi:glycosyltransferase 2 family protein